MSEAALRPRWEAALLGRQALPWPLRAAFLLGSAAHLGLDDAWQASWIVGDVLYGLGWVVLAWRPCALGWLLCAAGAAQPLLFARDHLTQSLLLLGISLMGAWTAAAAGWGGEEGRWAATLRRSLQSLTLVTYGLACLHKLNDDFLKPATSCAVYGADKLAAYYHLPEPPDALAAILPAAVLLAEAAIPALYLLGRRRWALAVALSFHVPLTLALAPAFALVMLAGHAAFITPADEAEARSLSRRAWAGIAGIAAAALAISVALHRALPTPGMLLKEWLLYALLAALAWMALTGRRGDDAASPPQPAAWRAPVALFTAALLLNGVTPYLGLQFQHAGAMLSNLRVDQGCWNSLIIPEAARLTDDYIRVEQAWLHTPGFLPEYEASLKEHLWSPPQLRQMQRTWCRRDAARPIHLEGTWRGRPFVIPDLCAAQDLPFNGDGIFGVELFPDALRFQKNLRRACPDACIH